MKFEIDQDYRELRKEAYPALAEQLDQIYHEGIDAWRERINEIKARYPKPAGSFQ